METKPKLTMTEYVALTWPQKLKNLAKHRYFWPAVITAASLIFTAFLVLEVQKRQEWRSKAAGEAVTVSFSPETAALTAADAETFRLFLNPGKPVAFISLEIDYDPQLVKLNQNISLLEAKFNQIIKISTPDEANAAGKAVITVGLDPNQKDSPPAEAFALADLVFAANTANPDLTGSLTINPDVSQVVATDLTSGEAIALTITASPVSLALNPASGPKLFFSAPVPANPQTTGQNFTINLLANTENQEVYGVDAVILFDSSKLAVVKIDPAADNGFYSYPVNTYDNSAGEARFSANIGAGANTPAVKANNLVLAAITFQPKTTGDSTIRYDFTPGERNDSNMVKKNADPSQDPVDILALAENITINTQPAASASPQPSPSPSPSASPAPSPSPNPSASPAASASPSPLPSPSPTAESITLKFKIQGRNRTGTSQIKTIAFSYLTGSFSGSAAQKSLTTDNNGAAAVSLIPGNYIFLAKTPGYLAKRFGSRVSPVSITGAGQTLDLTAGQLLGGDLNNDGGINEIDYAAVFLPKFGSADAASDLDGSGEVNNLDFAIMRANWNLVNDDF